MKVKSEPELDQKLLIENNDREDCHYERSNKFLSLRFFISFVSLLGCAVMYMTRNNLNVAIVDMVTTFKSDPLDNGSTLVTDQCPIDRSNSSVNWKKGEFNWTPSTQGIVLGAFYYGYVWPQIFGGRLSEIYGSKHMIGFSIFISGLINLLTPFIIRYDFNIFILSRVLLGLVQGILFPSFMSLLAKWIPRSEHSTFIPWLDVGCTVGTVIVSAGAGHLIENNVMGGWPSVFYISGIFAILWCLIWFPFVTSSPSTHSWITARELKHIIKESETSKYRHIRQTFPWSNVLTSKAFIAVLMTKLLFGITWDLINAKIPAYLQDVIHFPISENGMIYSILMIALAVTTLGSGFIADAIIETKKISKTNVRKIFQTISGIGMAVTLVLIPFVRCDKQLNIALLTACTLLMGIPSGGDIPIIADMTEEFAGTVFAIINCISSINGFIVPYVVGLFINKNPDSMKLWSYLFYFSAILNIIGVLIFALFSTAEPQHWECADFDNDYTILYDKKAVMKKKKNRVLDKYSL